MYIINRLNECTDDSRVEENNRPYIIWDKLYRPHIFQNILKNLKVIMYVNKLLLTDV